MEWWRLAASAGRRTVPRATEPRNSGRQLIGAKKNFAVEKHRKVFIYRV